MTTLAAQLKAVTKQNNENWEAVKTQRERADTAERELKKVRAQIDDLKERLAVSTSANDHMRGYIARVQEDDVVREELVTTGDPAGEQHLTPKRKPTPFAAPSAYRDFTEQDRYGMSVTNEERRRNTKHWVTY